MSDHKLKTKIRPLLFMRSKTMLSDNTAPKGATIESQLKRVEAAAKKRGILNFNIDSNVTNTPVVEGISKSDPRKSRLIVFKKNVPHDKLVRDLESAGEHLLFGTIDALEMVIGLISKGAMDKKDGFVILIFLNRTTDGLHSGLRVWHNEMGVLGMRVIEFRDDYVHSGGRGALIGQELDE